LLGATCAATTVVISPIASRAALADPAPMTAAGYEYLDLSAGTMTCAQTMPGGLDHHHLLRARALVDICRYFCVG
jgi:hypothetical protein